eukprot:1606584-Rhodomonas_salina.4
MPCCSSHVCRQHAEYALRESGACPICNQVRAPTRTLQLEIHWHQVAHRARSPLRCGAELKRCVAFCGETPVLVRV